VGGVGSYRRGETVLAALNTSRMKERRGGVGRKARGRRSYPLKEGETGRTERDHLSVSSGLETGGGGKVTAGKGGE